jgi:hypothetical protein
LGFVFGDPIWLKTMLKSGKAVGFVVEKCVEKLLKDFGGWVMWMGL